MRVKGLVTLCLGLVAAPAWSDDEDNDINIDLEVPQQAVQRAMEDARRQVEQAREQMQAAMSQLRVLSREGHLHWRHGHSPRLGVMIQEGDEKSDGLSVEAVNPGGPADKAGIKVGDLLLSAAGQSLGGGKGRRPLLDAMEKVKAGESLALEYRRGKEVTRVNVVLPERPAIPEPPEAPLPPMPPLPPIPPIPPEAFSFRHMSDQWHGIDLLAVNPELGEYFGVKQGVLVVKTAADNKLPLKAGDVIVAVGDRQPTTPSQVVRILRSYEPGETAKLDVVRKKDKQTLSVPIPPR